MTHQAWLCNPGEPPAALEAVAFVDTEKILEEWIEADPSIVGDGLVVVGRQVKFEGGHADLVAIDPQGRWVVIEIKRGRNVRQDLAQALDYGSSLAYESADSLRSRLSSALTGKPHREAALAAMDAALTDEGPLPREVALLITGVGVQDSTERIQQHLRHYGMDVRVTTLEAHRASDGRIVLVRDVDGADEGDSASSVTADREDWDERVERIRAVARDGQVLPALDRWLKAVDRAGLLARPYKHSIMVGPPTHKNAFLMVGRPVVEGGIRFNHGAREFAQWFPWITAESVDQHLGPSLRGMGTVYTGQDLDRYVSAVEEFLGESFPPPPEFDAFMTQQQWDRDQFVLAFSNRPELQPKIERLLDSAAVDFGAGAAGQAHLVFTEGGPQILQVTTAGLLRGMWTLGSHEADDPGWQPLKQLLAPWGGLGPQGQAPKVNLETLSDADLDALLAVARQTSENLQSR